jgi:hypothetical protein
MSKTEQKQVEAQCGSCRGTGIYRGFAEPRGIGVVCVECKGTGKRIITYTPFTVRQKRDDVQFVQRSAGTLLVTGVGPTSGKISYADFLAGKMP